MKTGVFGIYCAAQLVRVAFCIDIAISVAKLLMFIAIFIKMLLKLPEGHNIFRNPNFSYIYITSLYQIHYMRVYESIMSEKSVPKFTN